MNRPITKRFDHRVSGFFRGEERFGHSCVDLPRSFAVRGTEAPSRLGRTWFLQAQDIMWPLALDWEASSRPIQWRIGVSVTLIIVNTALHAPLSLPEWQISYGKHLEGAYHVLKLRPLHVRNLHDWISFDGTSPRLGPTLRLLVLVGFYIPNPRVLIRDRIAFTTMPYLQNSRQTGTHRWHTTEENAVFVALDLICF